MVQTVEWRKGIIDAAINLISHIADADHVDKATRPRRLSPKTTCELSLVINGSLMAGSLRLNVLPNLQSPVKWLATHSHWPPHCPKLQLGLMTGEQCDFCRQVAIFASQSDILKNALHYVIVSSRHEAQLIKDFIEGLCVQISATTKNPDVQCVSNLVRSPIYINMRPTLLGAMTIKAEQV